MADRTSAALFGELFNRLADMEMTEQVQSLATWAWDQTGEYDFSTYQMGCDDALVKLGLAKRGVDPEYPEGGECVMYLGEDY